MRGPKAWLCVSALALSLSACAGVTRTPTAGRDRGATDRPVLIPASISPPAAPLGRIRRAVVAGSWYPGEPEELARQVDSMLASVDPVDGAPIALIVPHAGYAYSGPVAATGFKQLGEGQYDIAVIVASDHQMPLSRPISLWAEGGFETPLGVVPVDTEVSEALLAADPRIRFDPEAHEGEHPIEIELPFLQRVCPTCRIVPLLMGTDDEETVEALARALLQVLPGRRAVILASSDLSHYPSYDQAIGVDAATLGAIETGDPARVRERIDELMAVGTANLVTCACGKGPILVAMHVAKGLGADTVTVLGYANSGQTLRGDRSRVVGYGAVMFWRYQSPDLADPSAESY